MNISTEYSLLMHQILQQNDGWAVFKVWHFDEGKKVLNIEQKIFKILREDMEIPQYLSKGAMKHEGESTVTERLKKAKK